ncbi:MAG: putative membrane protein YadS [Polaribacter sp.]|jgi:uncharacterized membrane protein YadS
MPKSPLLLKEDYWAIWIGGFILFFGLLVFFLNQPADLTARHEMLESQMEAEQAKAKFKTIGWYEAFDKQKKIKGASEPIGKFLKNLTTKPGSWMNNPLDAFVKTEEQIEAKKNEITAKYELAITREKQAKEESAEKQEAYFLDGKRSEVLALEVTQAIENWRSEKETLSRISKKMNTKATNKIPWLFGMLFLFALLIGIGASVMGTPFLNFTKAFSFVFFIGLVSYTLAAQTNMKAIGFGYAAWAIIIGLLISNTIGTPRWVAPGLTTEFYIKTGLVILGAEILLGKILAIGLPGIFVAWIVTPVVLVSTYWFGQKVLKISSKTLNMTISADMSVCGVSAAVAVAAACKASKEELTVAIGLSMVFTSVMMIVMPAFINWVGMPEILGGAWIGGTIDATGAVVAAGAFLGEKALSVAATIKMIQNVLIGIIAFAVAVYFAKNVDKEEGVEVGWGEIWNRFPKFILGFLGASVLFSAIYAFLGNNNAYTMIDQGVIAAFTKNIRGWLFCLAFVSIGLSINFKALRKHFVGGKPFILYMVGQTFNLCLTLLMAYIMFYLVFPGATAGI